MSNILFRMDELKKLVMKDEVQSLYLVGDQGIYIMSFDQNEQRDIIYAKGCNPEKDTDWYSNKCSLYGGDDGGDDVSHLIPVIATSKASLLQIELA